MTTRELADLLAVLKDHGVLSFEGLGVKVELERRAPDFADLSRAEREKEEEEEERRIALAHVGIG